MIFYLNRSFNGFQVGCKINQLPENITFIDFINISLIAYHRGVVLIINMFGMMVEEEVCRIESIYSG
jgi:hypothetical protein